MLRSLARQLGSPSGLFGGFLARLWNFRNAALNESALSCLDLSGQDRVLEVGFGGGYLLDRMRDKRQPGPVGTRLFGVDRSASMARFCAERFSRKPRTPGLGCAAAEALPFASGSFTCLVTVNSIFYWQNIPQALAEFYRVLARPGRLVLVFTARGSLKQKGFARHGLTLPEPEEIAAWLRAAGFQNVTCQPGADRYRQFWRMVAVR